MKFRMLSFLFLAIAWSLYGSEVQDVVIRSRAQLDSLGEEAVPQRSSLDAGLISTRRVGNEQYFAWNVHVQVEGGQRGAIGSLHRYFCPASMLFRKWHGVQEIQQEDAIVRRVYDEKNGVATKKIEVWFMKRESLQGSEKAIKDYLQDEDHFVHKNFYSGLRYTGVGGGLTCASLGHLFWPMIHRSVSPQRYSSGFAGKSMQPLHMQTNALTGRDWLTSISVLTTFVGLGMGAYGIYNLLNSKKVAPSVFNQGYNTTTAWQHPGQRVYEKRHKVTYTVPDKADENTQVVVDKLRRTYDPQSAYKWHIYDERDNTLVAVPKLVEQAAQEDAYVGTVAEVEAPSIPGFLRYAQYMANQKRYQLRAPRLPPLKLHIGSQNSYLSAKNLIKIGSKKRKKPRPSKISQRVTEGKMRDSSDQSLKPKAKHHQGLSSREKLNAPVGDSLSDASSHNVAQFKMKHCFRSNDEIFE